MDSETPLPAAIDRFIAEHGMSPVTFGRKALNDPHFVRDLRKGRRVWPETDEKVRSFMSAYQPAEARAA
jgi:2,4-dienoyl-CoA reductase-like NADH-dependent reductase (Old Yellow Enzyme family)